MAMRMMTSVPAAERRGIGKLIFAGKRLPDLPIVHRGSGTKTSTVCEAGSTIASTVTCGLPTIDPPGNPCQRNVFGKRKWHGRSRTISKTNSAKLCVQSFGFVCLAALGVERELFAEFKDLAANLLERRYVVALLKGAGDPVTPPASSPLPSCRAWSAPECRGECRWASSADWCQTESHSC